MSLANIKTRWTLAYLLMGGAFLAIHASVAYLGLESNEAWRASVFLLLGSAALAAVASLAFFIMALVGWRTPFRNRRFVRAALLAVAAVAMCAAPIVLAEFVWIPSMARRQEQAFQERRAASSRIKTGEAAPVFKIDTDEGLTFALGDQRGKVVLVNFFATWCLPCIQELPHLEGLWNEHKHRTDFALIVIGREETAETVQAFKKKRGFSFPIAADPEGAVFSLFAEERIPRTYIIARDGTVCCAETGFADEQDFNRRIKTALQRELAK